MSLNDTLIKGTKDENLPKVLNETVTTTEVTTSDEKSQTTDPDTNTEFNRENIEALGNRIRLVDVDEANKLDLFCYVKCTDKDPDLLKQCRGVVFNGKDIVMKAFPFTSEHIHTEITSETLPDNFDKYTFFESHEGALVRVFYFNDKWYVSTHRKLNAFKSKWASRESFGTLFKNALTSEEEHNTKFKNFLGKGENILDGFLDSLDKNNKYMFLICNNEDNRIVCDVPERPRFYYVGTFTGNNFNLERPSCFPVPKQIKFMNIDEISTYVDNIDYTKLQGVICFGPDNSQCKIIHKKYNDLFKARGNEPSIKFRYLQVRMNRRLSNTLYKLYPNMSSVFDDYENILYDISRGIYRAYVQRFIKKRYVTVPREEFQVIRDCHSWHLSNRTVNRISLEQIIKVMNLQSPTNLNHMIRRFRSEQIRKKEQQETMRPRSDSTISIENSPAIQQIKTPTINVSPLILPVTGKIENVPSL